MSELKDDLAALRITREPERPAGSRWTGWAILAVLILAVAVGGWYWFSRETPLEVEVSTVTERGAGVQAAVLNASGYVTARRRVKEVVMLSRFPKALGTARSMVCRIEGPRARSRN